MRFVDVFLGVTLLVGGLSLLVFARRVSFWKTSGWKTWYARHPKAAQVNPLSDFAGTETSIKTGALIWRLIGILILLIGALRLLRGWGT